MYYKTGEWASETLRTGKMSIEKILMLLNLRCTEKL